MRWRNPFKTRHTTVNGSALRDELFNALQSGDERQLEVVCRTNHDRILDEFKTWLRAPDAVRANPEAIGRYGQGLIAVAQWFDRHGSPQLLAALKGEGRDNPISRWEN